MPYGRSIFISTGFDAFLSKPIDTAQLNALLNKYIRDKQPPGVLAAARAEMVRRADEKRRRAGRERAAAVERNRRFCGRIQVVEKYKKK